MTDFEQQVAVALEPVIAAAKCPDGFPNPSHWELAAYIAPYVAAAIEMALRADGAHPGSYEAALRELGH